MSFVKHGLAESSLELGKSVLTLSGLGVFTKLLHIDLSQMQFLGITLGAKEAPLIPGFIGIALIFVYCAFILARVESTLDHSTDKDAQKTHKKIRESKFLLWTAALAAPLAFLVYSLPYVFGFIATKILWSDAVTVFKLIWSLI